MCNAWKHAPGCNCGWGGEYHGGGGGSGGFVMGRSFASQLFSGRPTLKKAAANNQAQKLEDAWTRKMNCWWCGESVFYHTNGYGDCVLFDSLGYPWKVHACWQDYWAGKKALRTALAPTSTLKSIMAQAQRYAKSGQVSIYRALMCPSGQQQYSNQRIAVLAGAIYQSRFIPDELTVATRLGLTIEQLRTSYGDLYFIDRSTNGIQLIPPQLGNVVDVIPQRKSSTERPRTATKQQRKPVPKPKKRRQESG